MDFSAIDWQRPWLAHLSEIGCRLAACKDWKAEANLLASERGLKNAKDLPEAIQWHEGLLLAPQHFQQLAQRSGIESVLLGQSGVMQEVRRMILRMKAQTQAARALVYHAAGQVDRADSGDAAARLRLELLTPLQLELAQAWPGAGAEALLVRWPFMGRWCRVR